MATVGWAGRCTLLLYFSERDQGVVTGPAFVEAVAHTLNTTLAIARWDTSAVLAALADL